MSEAANAAGKRTGGYNRNRPRPTAYLNGNPTARGTGAGGTGRTIILSTGRGCVSIDPAEADALAAELTAAAKAVRERAGAAPPEGATT